MTRRLTYRLGFLAILGLSCNQSNILGENDCDPNEEGCVTRDPNRPVDPLGPDHTDKIGPGSSTPFDPKEDGSSGVKLDPKGNIILDPGNVMGSMRPIIWVANSSEGTVSKVDTRTMAELARYVTYPGGGADPSRTTVSLEGDVVVANRAGGGPKSSAVKIAGDKSACIDRNGNGKIDTFEGSGGVPAQFQWQDGQANSPDECVLWFTPLKANSYPRAAGFDATASELGGFVYIGLWRDHMLVQLNAKTGQIVKEIDLTEGGTVRPNPYGLVLDRDGNVWIWSSTGWLVRVTPKGEVKNYNQKPTPCGYGITADAKGLIYTTGGHCVARFDPSSETYEVLSLKDQGASSLRGVAMDQKYGLWIAETTTGMYHVDASGAKMVYKGMVPVAGSNVGAAVDFDGKPWVISQRQQGVAYRIDRPDPTTYKANGVDVGAGPYTYSDMTGFQLRNAGAPNGVYRRTFLGCGPNTRWFDLNWELTAPALTGVVINVRFGATLMALMNAPWQQVSPPDKAPIGLQKFVKGARPDYMQVEFRLNSQDPKITPILSGVTASYSCNVLG